jgi:hypothetical protein
LEIEMGIEAWLIHTCVVENPTEGGEDRYGNVVPGYEEGVPTVCRLVEEQERAWVDVLAQSVTVTIYKMLLPPDVEVKERARISEVVLEDGTEVDGVFFVKAVLARRGRGLQLQTVTLERVG